MAILAELYKIIVVIDSTYKSNKNPAMSNYFSFIECQHDSKTIANKNCPFPDIHGASFTQTQWYDTFPGSSTFI